MFNHQVATEIFIGVASHIHIGYLQYAQSVIGKLRALTSDLTTWTVGSQLCVLCYHIYSCFKVSQLQMFCFFCSPPLGLVAFVRGPWQVSGRRWSAAPSLLARPALRHTFIHHSPWHAETPPLHLLWICVCLCGRAHCPQPWKYKCIWMRLQHEVLLCFMQIWIKRRTRHNGGSLEWSVLWIAFGHYHWFIKWFIHLKRKDVIAQVNT